ncbi:MAG: histidine kinase, partial [Sediminibacterium sp.]|nr:histidine kinase [Sediminibacterium sp.]
YLWDVKTGKTNLYFPDQSITDIVKDYQGNYWVSTLDNGLFVCPSLENKLYKMHLGEMDNITAITPLNNHQVITGSSKGLLTSFDVNENTVFQYNLSEAREIEFIHYDTLSKYIFTNRGIIKSGEKNPFEIYDYSKQIARDPFGNIIVAYFSGAYILNNQFGKYVNRSPEINCNLYKKFTSSMVYGLIKNVLVLRTTRSNTVLASANKERFWVAYVDGLFEYQYNDSFRVIKTANDLPIVAKTLYEMKDGSLIAGTSTDGIYIIKNGLVTHHFDKSKGLKSDNIKHCNYFNNAIWALTDESLELINISTGTITNLSDEFGFEQLQVNDFAVNPERFFLATTNGVLVNSFPKIKQERVISFPTFYASANGVPFGNRSVLAYDKNNIIFNIEALHFKSPTSLIYKYRMIGLDSTWKTTNYFSSSITYNRLAAGNYTFQIQAQDRSGYYKSKMLAYAFKILLPFWLRWWFIVLVLLSTMGLVYLLLRWWSKRILLQQTLKEQIYKSQLVALRSQMNPHFLYNVLNTVQGLLYDNRKTEAGTLLGNFSDLMRKTLKASDSQLQTLHEEVENLHLYLELEKARFDKDFSYDIQTNLKDDAASIYIPSLMLQPFVENAVKHGLMHKHGHKELFILFDQIEDGLKVVIEDNGIGRKQSAIINSRNKSKPTSFATKAIAERIQLFNRLYKQQISYNIIDKIDNANMPTGTLITMIIPDYANGEADF